jgi:murein DD-endopeptidase MepM/ murein hydrolase activator NlpD
MPSSTTSVRSVIARSTAVTLAVSAMCVASVVWTMAGSASGLDDDLLMSSSTTSTLIDAEAILSGLLGDSSSTTTSTSTTTTAPATTTTMASTTTTTIAAAIGTATSTTTTAPATTATDVAGRRGPVAASPSAVGDAAAGPAAAVVPGAVTGAASGARPSLDVASAPAAAGARAGSVPASRTVSVVAISPPGGRSTKLVFDRLAGTDLAPAALARLLAPFPVAGRAHYSSDFGAPRTVPHAHAHEGTDVFAARGTPVIASADGVVSRVTENSAISGTSLRLTTTGGTYFFYAHLDSLVSSMRDGVVVEKGDVLGFVGTTGNAAGTSPHLHYEIHPLGGAAVDPVPYLDQWLADAAAAAVSMRGSSPLSLAMTMPSGRPPRATAAPGLARSAHESPVSELPRLEPIAYSALTPAGMVIALAPGTFLYRKIRSRSRRRRST